MYYNFMTVHICIYTMIAHVTLTKLTFVPSFKGLTNAWGYVLCIERNLMIVRVHCDMQILVGRNTYHTYRVSSDD